MTDKLTPEDTEKIKKKVKGRLVCRGFEETFETLCMLLATAVSKDRNIKSDNIKKAYL